MNRFGSVAKPVMWFMSLLLSVFVAGCDGGGGGGGLNAEDGGVCSGAGCVPLGAAGTYVALSQAGISTVPASAVTGNIGVSPIDRTGLTGFSETMNFLNTFSTSAQVTGSLYAADYAPPTPANLTTAVADMNTAYTDAAGRLPATTTDFNGGVLDGGLVIPPGIHKFNSGVSLDDVAITGTATDVWIFQVGGALSQAANSTVTLAGGALAKNVFWQVDTNVAIGTGAHFEGIILAGTDIALVTGASVNGRLFSGTAVTFDQNTIVRPAP